MIDRRAFEDGIEFAQFLRMIEFYTETTRHHLANINDLLNRNSEDALRGIFNFKHEQVHLWYESAKRLYLKYYQKNPQILRERLRRLDEVLETFDNQYNELNKRIIDKK